MPHGSWMVTARTLSQPSLAELPWKIGVSRITMRVTGLG